jgi:hypothetical protein
VLTAALVRLTRTRPGNRQVLPQVAGDYLKQEPDTHRHVPYDGERSSPVQRRRGPVSVVYKHLLSAAKSCAGWAEARPHSRTRPVEVFEFRREVNVYSQALPKQVALPLPQILRDDADV